MRPDRALGHSVHVPAARAQRAHPGASPRPPGRASLPGLQPPPRRAPRPPPAHAPRQRRVGPPGRGRAPALGGRRRRRQRQQVGAGAGACRGGRGPPFVPRGSQPRARGAPQQWLRHLCGAPLPCWPLGRSGARGRVRGGDARPWFRSPGWGGGAGRDPGPRKAPRTGRADAGSGSGSDSLCASPSALPGARSPCAPLAPAALPLLPGTCLSSNPSLLLPPVAATPGGPALPYSAALHACAFSEVPRRRGCLSPVWLRERSTHETQMEIRQYPLGNGHK